MKRIALTVALGSLLALAGLTPSGPALFAQPNRLVSPDNGHVALGLAVRRLNTIGRFLQATAHPDDEGNGLLAMLSRGQGMQVALFTMTRGNGGQNEIGPELFEDLAVVRTAELLAAHRLDGADQYFARAVDFGYSFSTEETFRKWGKDEILADTVRIIRMLRPDVITAMPPDGTGGGQHHQASALITREAFRAAADPARFPEQIDKGLRPWQAKKLYFLAGFGRMRMAPAGVRTVPVDLNVFDHLLGRTYAEIGAEARAMHKCQGIGQVLPLPGPSGSSYRLADTVLAGQAGKEETGLFDGIDTSLAGLAAYAGPTPPAGLTAGLAAIAAEAERAQALFDERGDGATVPAIMAGIAAVQALRLQLRSFNLSAALAFEIEHRLLSKLRDFEHAALLAHGIVINALANDGLVYGGQPVRVSVSAANFGSAGIEVAMVGLQGFDGEAAVCRTGAVAPGSVFTCALDVKIPANAEATEPYWKPEPGAARSAFRAGVPFGVPFEPTPFRVRVIFRLAGTEIGTDVPVIFRSGADLFTGEKRVELLVVPAFSVRMNPGVVIVPAGARGLGRTVFVTVVNGTKGRASGTVKVRAPAGWTVTPPSMPVSLANEDEAFTVRFDVTVPPTVRTGDYRIAAEVTSSAFPGVAFSRGYQAVEYPHFTRRHVMHDAAASVKVLDVKTTPAVSVGYIMGVGDVVPQALEQIGATVTFIGADELAWGDLSKYDVIMTGIRAYERRADLRAYNRRLLEYVEGGGTAIVQYNKMEFNQAQYGPFPVRVSGSRATAEDAPVQVLVPDHPLFNSPNKVDPGTWDGWVQERGLYFLGERDPKYVDLIQVDEPFEYNKGIKTGALVEARYGKGRWLYLGLGLWRQVQAGTPGAYELLANLVSLR
ncbi:MAG: PIG-L family deacetylase [Acidobacteriota bacterium]